MMRFETQRLEIRPITPEDREAVLDLLMDETVGKTYMLPEYGDRQNAVPLFERLVLLSADESRYVAGVYLKGQFIGMMNETEIKGSSIEMGYAYLPAFYNRGYATEAFAGAIAYLFRCGFQTVVAGAFADNAASLRVMEKCGMIPTGQTEEMEYRGRTHRCVGYEISREAHKREQ